MNASFSVGERIASVYPTASTKSGSVLDELTVLVLVVSSNGEKRQVSTTRATSFIAKISSEAVSKGSSILKYSIDAVRVSNPDTGVPNVISSDH